MGFSKLWWLIPVPDTTLTIPLPQTIGLLDCLDTVRSRKIIAPEPHVLAQHLQTVCTTMGQIVSDEDAQNAVALHLDHALTSSGSCLGERPADADSWQRQLGELEAILNNQTRRLNQLKLWVNLGNRSRCVGILVTAITTFFNFAAMASKFGRHPESLPEHAYGVWGLISLVSFIGLVFWKRFRDANPQGEAVEKLIDDTKRQLYSLSEVPIKNRPNAATLAEWSKTPGLTAAFYHIHTSSVPMLRQDVKAMKARVAAVKTETKAVEDQRKLMEEERQWRQGFEKLAMVGSPP